MKKLLIVLLILLLCGCSSTVAPSQKVTIDSIQASKSKEELAAALNCDVSDLENIIKNLNNIYPQLPDKVETGEGNKA